MVLSVVPCKTRQVLDCCSRTSGDFFYKSTSNYKSFRAHQNTEQHRLITLPKKCPFWAGLKQKKLVEFYFFFSKHKTERVGDKNFVLSQEPVQMTGHSVKKLVATAKLLCPYISTVKTKNLKCSCNSIWHKFKTNSFSVWGEFWICVIK